MSDERHELSELYTALAEARKEFAPLTKSRTAKIVTKAGTSYTYNYADLLDVIEATGAALSAHGLSFVQEPEAFLDGGRVFVSVRAKILHSSGREIIMAPLTLPVGGDGDARSIGSAIAYARRYQMMSVFNLAAEDDDGAAADRQPAQRQRLPLRRWTVTMTMSAFGGLAMWTTRHSRGGSRPPTSYT